MPYVISLSSKFSNLTEYFTGHRYIYQGEQFAALDVKPEAKRYKSEKIAQRSADSLNDRCAQPGIFTVCEVEE